jgi:hypothetical protein
MAAALAVGTVAAVLPTKGLFFNDALACGTSSSITTAEAAVAVGVVGAGIAAASGSGLFFVPAKKGKAVDKQPGDTSISPFVGENGAPALPKGN